MGSPSHAAPVTVRPELVEGRARNTPFDKLRANGPGGAVSARGRERQAGFTLIEMMVALAVFSLAAMALIRLESATIRGATILDSTLIAQMVARNVAIEAVTDAQPPAIGNATGTERNGGRTWAWTRRTTPTGDTRILRIDVAVADQSGTVQGRLTMVRPATQPAATVTTS